MNLTTPCPPMLAAALLACLSVPASAIAADDAKGTLVLQSEDKPLVLTLTHAYYVIGPDTFDAKRITPRLILTGEDVREKIAACTDVDCATYAASDGLRLELDADAAISYWAHIRPMQYSGVIDNSQLTYSTRSPDRIAGQLRYRNSGVEVDVTFDATLVKTFPSTGK